MGLDEGAAVPHVDLHPGVVVAAGGLGQEFAGSFDDGSVDLANFKGFQFTVPPQFPQDAPVAAPDDQRPFGHVGAGVKGHVGHHFVIGELVEGGELDDAVQHEQTAQIDRFEDLQMLKGSLDVAELTADFYRQPPARIDFADPAFSGHLHASPRTAAVNSAKEENTRSGISLPGVPKPHEASPRRNPARRPASRSV